MNEDFVSNQPILNGFVKHMTKLERENRNLKKLNVFILVGMVLGLLLGATHKTPQTIEAERFVLKDTNGKQRTALHVTEQRGLGMVIFDTNQERRLF